MSQTTVAEKVFGPGLTADTPVAIGIDQSLTGFAFTVISVIDPTKYKTFVYKSPYNGVQRLSDISGWLVSKLVDANTLSKNKVQDIAIEGSVLTSFSALVLGELAATVKLSIWDLFKGGPPHLRTPLQIPPMTLKKYAAGKGNAKKQEMLLQIYKRYGIEFNDDNAADSYALARIAAGIVVGEIEAQIIEQIKDAKYRDVIK